MTDWDNDSGADNGWYGAAEHIKDTMDDGADQGVGDEKGRLYKAWLEEQQKPNKREQMRRRNNE